MTTGAREAGGKRIGMLGIRGGAVAYQRLCRSAGDGRAGVGQTWTRAPETLAGAGADDLLGGAARRISAARCASRSFPARWRSSAWPAWSSFIAVLSVNLGLINLFPIPVLDGGHLLFYLVEAIRGRPLPPRAQEYGFRAGLALLVGAVRVRHLERPDASGAGPLGRRTDRLSRAAGRPD